MAFKFTENRQEEGGEEVEEQLNHGLSSRLGFIVTGRKEGMAAHPTFFCK